MIRLFLTASVVLLTLIGADAQAAPGIPALTMEPGENGETYTLTLQTLILMTGLTLLPSALMMMTSFTRIIITLSILRTALGTQQAPSSQILVGLALFLTLFIMQPVFSTIYDTALKPYMDEQISAENAFSRAKLPLQDFMLQQTREDDIALFLNLSGTDQIASPEEVPFSVLVPAFVTSELKTAFQIGFLLFIPFLIIDLVVASVLMAMGMMMLSPMIISLPFKLMLFVLVDGWSLILGTLAGSFYPA